MKRRWYLALALGVCITFLIFLSVYLLKKKTAEGILEGSGQIRGTEITVSSKLAAKVEELLIKEGQAVSKGDLIATISSKEIVARVEQAGATADAARSRMKEIEAAIAETDTSLELAKVSIKLASEDSFHRIHRAKAALQRAEAEVTEAETQRNLAEKDFKRYSTLLKERVIALREFEQVEAGFKAAKARLEALRKAREETKAALESAEAASLEVSVKEKEYERLQSEKQRLTAVYASMRSQAEAAMAGVRELKEVLKDTSFYAPSGGTVINKLVEEGELVVAGTPIAILVDLSDIYARVYIPEKDIGRIRLGNPARIFSDAFPDRPFRGQVTEVSQKAEFTPKEVHMKEERTKLVFGIKVKIENPQGWLKLGMPVDVKIKWRDDVPW